jgi:hypothetical protein
MQVAVIGSGLGGLLTSALLRRRGVDVVRYEKAAHDGGRARSPMIGGRHVNLGPRALYRGGPLEKALASLGIRPTGFYPTGSPVLASFGGAIEPLPATAAQLVTSRMLDAGEKRAFALAFARVAVGALDVRDGEAIGAWLDRHTHGKARALLAMLVRVSTYSDDPSLDAKLALHTVRRGLTKGVLYVDGGWECGILDPLRAIAGDAVTRTIASVHEAVDAAGAEARHHQRGHHHGAVVDAAGISLDGGVPITASCLDVVLARLPRPERRVCFGVDEPTYLSVHTPLGVDGDVIVHVMGNGHAERSALERVLDDVQPGWRDALVEARYLSRMVVSTLPQAGHARAPCSIEERGVLIHRVGDGVDSGALLADGVAASAVRAVDAIVATGRRAAA